MLYEIVLLCAVIFFAGYVHRVLFGNPDSPASRLLFQGYLFLVLGAYFVWLWSRAGQTLALKTWRMRVVDANGIPPVPVRAAWRYLLAWGSLALFGIGFLWSLFDRDRQYLHDRLLGTRLEDLRNR